MSSNFFRLSRCTNASNYFHINPIHQSYSCLLLRDSNVYSINQPIYSLNTSRQLNTKIKPLHSDNTSWTFGQARFKTLLDAYLGLKKGSLDITQIGCVKCDKLRIDDLTNILKTGNNVFLDTQLAHVPNTYPYETTNERYTNGVVQLTRNPKANFILLPSFYNLARITTEKLILKLSKLPFARREATYRLRKDYLDKTTVWLDDLLSDHNIDRSTLTKGEIRVHPILTVCNPNSNSTPLRLVLDPSRSVKIDQKDIENARESGHDVTALLAELPHNCISWNKTIRSYTLVLPNLRDIALATAISQMTYSADISDGFKSILYSFKDQLQHNILVLKSKDGLPTLDMEDCADSTLHELTQRHASYGESDLPVIFCTVVAKCCLYFRQHYPENVLSEEEIKAVESLKKILYVDDVLAPSNIHMVISFLSHSENKKHLEICLIKTIEILKCSHNKSIHVNSLIDLINNCNHMQYVEIAKSLNTYYCMVRWKAQTTIFSFSGMRFKNVDSDDADCAKLLK